MATKIVFIEEPKFEVDFRAYASSASLEDIKTQSAAQVFFKFIPILMASMVKASWVTLRYSGVSFKQNVLGFYGIWSNFHPPSDLYLAVFKIAFWTLGLAWCATTTTIHLVIQDLFPVTPMFLANWAEKGIDIRHIQTSESAIDVSDVAPHVRVDDLLAIYDEINFGDPQALGFMANTCRQEGDIIYSISNLREALVTFVHQVNNRVPFLGTPPAYDTPRLMAFYQQIEDAVRFSIDASNKRIAAFKADRGTEVAEYSAEDRKRYHGLLEDRARIAIDLAIAGKHCGARYMGEAMSVYGNARGEDLHLKGTLQDSIFELLARKRYVIACSQIQSNLGNDTHPFNKYMANLGQILGLPGTKNVIEHLDTEFKRDVFLQRFFEEYTEAAIIKFIQDEVGQSQIFYEKIIDWVKDQVGSWSQDLEDQALEELTTLVLEAIRKPVASDPIELLESLVQYLKSQEGLKIPSPERGGDCASSETFMLPTLENDWEDYVTELFRLPAVIQWRNKKFSEDDAKALIQNFEILNEDQQKTQINAYRRIKIEPLKQQCIFFPQEKIEECRTKSGLELLDSLVESAQMTALMRRVRSIVPLLEADTIGRGLVNPELFREAIASRQEGMRSNKFLQTIAPRHLIDKQEKRSLTPEFMEWLLVSQGVFTAQVGG